MSEGRGMAVRDGETPDPEMRPAEDDFATFARMIRFWATVKPDRTAIVCLDRQTTYADFDRRTDRLANALRDRLDGADSVVVDETGRRVGILARNSDVYLEVLFAIAKAGMAAVVLNWRLSPRELATIAADAALDLLFHEAEFAEATAAIMALGDCPTVPLGSGAQPSVGYRDFLASSEDTRPPAVPGDTICLLLYTSGTTGTPKGVMQDQQRLLLNAFMADVPGPRADCRTGDVNLLTTPLFHLAGIGWSTTSLGQGATLIVPPMFDMAQLGEAIETHGVTRATILPAMMPSLLEAADRGVDLSSLRLICYGASAIPEPLLARMVARFACGFLQNYGMSEITGNATFLPPEAHYTGSPYLLSCGIPYPGVTLRIDEPDGSGVGEVMIRCPSLMRGYWRQHERTATVVHDGWYASGDLGLLDAAGYLFLRDRKKDMIISGGENIYPAEVEAALREHPAVMAVAVIGIPSAMWGEEPKAYVVTRPGETVAVEDLLAFARARIARFKVPRSIAFIAALPLTALGKIAKEDLRAPYWAGRARRIN